MPDISPESLYHFCTAEEGMAALGQSQFPWQSIPAQSGLDVSATTPLSFDIDTLQKSSIKLAVSLIFGREEPRGETPLIAAIRRWREEQRFATPEEAEPVLNELLGKMVDHRQGEIEKLMAEWRSFCAQTRYCSLFEKPDALELWHYKADACSGMAFKFLMAEDGAFGNLKAVQYGPEKPEITTLKDQMGTLFYNIRDKSRDNFVDKTLQRAPIFKAEKEWRTFAAPAGADQGLAFNNKELKALYLGPTMADEARHAVIEIAKGKWPELRLFQAQFTKTKFSLSFEAIA